MQIRECLASVLPHLIYLPLWALVDTYGSNPAGTVDGPSNGMRIATYNLRYDSIPDNITVQQSLSHLPDPLTEPLFLHKHGEQPWSKRRLHVAHHILSENVDVFCVQEALIRQVNDLQELLGDGWDHIGIGRDDGKQAGEHSAIYYRRSSIRLNSWDSFWLSLQPFEPSKHPDAGSRRICTAAHFTLTGSNATSNFTLLNTHLDDRSDDQRKLAGAMLLMRARYEAANTGGPVFVVGDFNSPPTGPDAGAYNIITGAIAPVPVPADFEEKYKVKRATLPDFKLLDLRAVVPRHVVGTNYATFTGFTAPDDASIWSRIDFIFGANNGGWEATRYKVDTALTDDGTLASDHRPVFVDVVL